MTTCAVCQLSDGLVTNVIVAKPTDVAPQDCKLVEITEATNSAGVGYLYIPSVNKFQGIQPYSSWVLNTETYLWEAPIPYPTDEKNYYWDEVTTSWAEENDGN
jgi:hypothetical protein